MSRNVKIALTALVAALMFLLVGCGGSSSSAMANGGNTYSLDTTPGWDIQITRRVMSHIVGRGGPSYDWILVADDFQLSTGDRVDLDLVQTGTGRKRGGYDLIKAIVLPDGTVVGNEAFGPDGYELTKYGPCKFFVGAAAAGGNPHASCTRFVAEGKG